MKTCAILLLQAMAAAADAPVRPVTVCEILKDIQAYEGKTVSVVGRYSFRENGRFLSEDACEARPNAGEKSQAGVFRLQDDGKSGPVVPRVLEVNPRIVREKLDEIRHNTSLRQFRFGSSDYDRWALIYGQIERRPSTGTGKNSPDGVSPALLLIRGDGAIVFLTGE